MIFFFFGGGRRWGVQGIVEVRAFPLGFHLLECKTWMQLCNILAVAEVVNYESSEEPTQHVLVNCVGRDQRCQMSVIVFNYGG